MNKAIEVAIERIKSYNNIPLNIMEVCGTHTMNIARYGIRKILPNKVKLISGPGCPVCVTPNSYFLKAIDLCRRRDVIITSFGDLLRVPTNGTSLLKEKRLGKDIRIIYSPLECLKIARENPNKKIVFLSVGFETTTPITALTILKAREQGIKNFFVLCGNKRISPIMEELILDSEVSIDGFILPGNVAVIIGEVPFKELLQKTQTKGVICGFKPADIIKGIESIIFDRDKTTKNIYKEVVLEKGNTKAQSIMNKVFIHGTSEWRGIGKIDLSGMELDKDYSQYNGEKLLNKEIKTNTEQIKCSCGNVLKGKIAPNKCPLFKEICTPLNPIGPCMVSSEGACAAYFMEGNYNEKKY